MTHQIFGGGNNSHALPQVQHGRWGSLMLELGCFCLPAVPLYPVASPTEAIRTRDCFVSSSNECWENGPEVLKIFKSMLWNGAQSADVVDRSILDNVSEYWFNSRLSASAGAPVFTSERCYFLTLTILLSPCHAVFLLDWCELILMSHERNSVFWNR